jgi:hypothetical protein
MHWSCRASHLRPETVCDRMRKENRAELCMTQKRLSMRVARLECKNSSTRTLGFATGQPAGFGRSSRALVEEHPRGPLDDPPGVRLAAGPPGIKYFAPQT